MADSLKLRAKSATDLALISTLLQDALISGADMTFDPAAKRFIAVFNRFCWELDGAMSEDEAEDEAVQAPASAQSPPTSEAGQTPCYHRSHAGLVVDRVRGVQSKGIDLGEKGKLLNLLSIHALDGCVELMFSGGSALRLKTTGVLVHLKDLGDRWPTQWRPNHGHDAAILAEAAAQSATANKHKDLGQGDFETASIDGGGPHGDGAGGSDGPDGPDGL